MRELASKCWVLFGISCIPVIERLYFVQDYVQEARERRGLLVVGSTAPCGKYWVLFDISCFLFVKCHNLFRVTFKKHGRGTCTG